MEDIATIILKLPRDIVATPESTETFLSTILNLNKTSFYHKIFGKTLKKIILEITLNNSEINFQITTNLEILDYIKSQLESVYSQITFIEQKSKKLPENSHILNLYLKNGNYYPIKTYHEFNEVDPLTSILGVLSKASPQTNVIIQYNLWHVNPSWKSKAENYAMKGTKREDGSFTPRPDNQIIKEKISHEGFKVGIKIISNDKEILTQIEHAYDVFASPQGNNFTTRKPFMNSTQILNIPELATIWHLPTEKVKIININWGDGIVSEPPPNLPIASDKSHEGKSHINFFGKTIFKNEEHIFGIKDADRRRHIWAIGKTGTGKSTLIANMVIDDLRKKKGVAIIDPHGDLCEVILDYIPKDRIREVIYFDPSQKEMQININPLEVRDSEEAELVVSGIISVFNKIFGSSWGPRLEYILRNSLLTLTQIPNSTLKDIVSILTNTSYRREIVSQISDPVLKSFWIDEFEKMPEKLQKEAISPILNKIGQFVGSPLIRRIIDSPKSTINIEEVINGKILLVNLSQGKIGKDNAALLGAMLITKIQLAAMRRVYMEEKDRRDFYLYVDEFQNFATNSFIKILSEARKYRLNLILANQYMAQIPIEVQKAILGNAGTIISFAIGAEDAHIIHKEFSEVFTEGDLVNMKNYQIAIKMMVDAHSQRPFIAETLPLPAAKNNNKEKVIRMSQRNWGGK